ncbi:MAG TPA: hypothetical protein VGY30_04665 [Solirubrobacteraceae bacterium]|jgi:hypothetical protein|nr:hypothetical protein [Solirubrobacteraceae bacterium]
MDGFNLTDHRRRSARALGRLGPAWLALGSALAIVTGGCAGSAVPGTTVSPERTPEAAAASLVRRAAAATLAAPAGVEFKLEGASAFGPSRAPVLGSGEFDFPSATGVEKIDLGEAGGREPGNEQALFLSERVYLQPKGLGSSVLPTGREWVSATLTGSDAVSTNFPSFVLQVEAVDPRLPLSELAGGAVAAAPTGVEPVGGVPARRYLVTIDLARALSALSGPDAAALGQAIQSELAAPGGGGQTSIAVWIGAGRVLQMRSAPPGAGTGTATMTLCCFGEPVAVSAPPSARVVDIASLTPSGERENNGGGDSDGG